MKKEGSTIAILLALLLMPVLVYASSEPGRIVIKAGDSISIKRVPNDEQVVEDIVEYSFAAQTAAVAATQAATTIAAAQNINFFQYLRVFFSFFVARRGPKKDFWGLVYDASNSAPIPFAVIRVYTTSSNSLINTTVSDLEGRYGLLLEPGEYQMKIEHQEFSFPIDDKHAVALQNDNQIYLGGKIKISKSVGVNFNIPMLPRKYKSGFSFAKLRQKWVNSGIAKLTQNMYFIYTFFIFNLLLLIDSFSWIYLLITVYYGIFVLIHLLSYYRKPPKTWGSVVNSFDSKPVPYAFIKLYSKKDGALVDSKITDRSGKFQFFASDGEYSVLVQAAGYVFPSQKMKKELKDANLKLVDFKVRKLSVNLNITLDPLVKGAEGEDQSFGTEKFAYTQTSV